MSRIGKLPIPVLDTAKVEIDGQTVRIEGPKGKLEKTFDRSVKIELSIISANAAISCCDKGDQ